MSWFSSFISTPASIVNPYLSAQGIAYNGLTGNSGSSTLSGSNADARNADLEAGYAKGKELFYNDPEMQQLKKTREDLAKGYNGQELGAIRGEARSQISGQRQGYQNQLTSNLARGGVGGARAAAVKSAADQGYNKNAASAERQMAADNANMVRQGQNNLQDFIFNQKYGELGTGLGYAQLGVADRSADAQAALAAQQGKKGVMDDLFGWL